jgi:hypothetical protein
LERQERDVINSPQTCEAADPTAINISSDCKSASIYKIGLYSITIKTDSGNASIQIKEYRNGTPQQDNGAAMALAPAWPSPPSKEFILGQQQ